MEEYESLSRNGAAIEAKLGYRFQERGLLALAFVHRSYVNEHREIAEHNERLEFLGDSILGLLIADYLYRYLPSTPEGDLSFLRSRLVEASSCHSYVQKLDVEEYLLLGKGEKMNDGRGRDTILADLFEAVIGAIFLDGGLEAAQHFFFSNFSVEVDKILKMPVSNWKALLQDYCQKRYQKPPDYRVEDESGPDHSKRFKVAVYIDGKELGTGAGSSKKEAQQASAQDALSKLPPQ